MTKKQNEPVMCAVSDLKPGDMVGLSKCDAYIKDVKVNNTDDGNNTSSLTTVTYVKAHERGEGKKPKTHTFQAYCTEGCYAIVERIPHVVSFWDRIRGKVNAE